MRDESNRNGGELKSRNTFNKTTKRTDARGPAVAYAPLLDNCGEARPRAGGVRRWKDLRIGGRISPVRAACPSSRERPASAAAEASCQRPGRRRLGRPPVEQARPAPRARPAHPSRSTAVDHAGRHDETKRPPTATNWKERCYGRACRPNEMLDGEYNATSCMRSTEERNFDTCH